MGAEFIDQAVAAFGVAKGKKALRERLHPHRWAFIFRKFFGEQDRQPVAAEQLTHLGAGTGLGQEIVLFFPEHRNLREQASLGPRRSRVVERTLRGANVGYIVGHDPGAKPELARRPRSWILERRALA